MLVVAVKKGVLQEAANDRRGTVKPGARHESIKLDTMTALNFSIYG
jgi:hypothetical protein